MSFPQTMKSPDGYGMQSQVISPKELSQAQRQRQQSNQGKGETFSNTDLMQIIRDMLANEPGIEIPNAIPIQALLHPEGPPSQQVFNLQPEEHMNKQRLGDSQFYVGEGDFIKTSFNRVKLRRELEEKQLKSQANSLVGQQTIRSMNRIQTDPLLPVMNPAQAAPISRDAGLMKTGGSTTKVINVGSAYSLNPGNMEEMGPKTYHPRENANSLGGSLTDQNPFSIESSISNVSVLTQKISGISVQFQDTSDTKGRWFCSDEQDGNLRIRSFLFGLLIVALQIFVIIEYGFTIPIANPSINLNSLFVSICISILSVLGFGLLIGSSKSTSSIALTQSWIAVAIAIELQPVVSSICYQKGLANPSYTNSDLTVNFSVSPNDTTSFLAPNLSITNAMKCGIATIIALSGVLKHTLYSKFSFELTSLEYFIVSLIGVIGAEISRITAQKYSFDVLGSSSVFGFGGSMGMTLALILGFRVRSYRKAEYDLIKGQIGENLRASGILKTTHFSTLRNSFGKTLSLFENRRELFQVDPQSFTYSLQRAKAFNALLGCLITFVFLPVLARDTAAIYLTQQGASPVYTLYPYYVCTACVTLAMGASFCTALSVSNLFRGESKVYVWDLVYAPLTGAICVGASSLYVLSPSQPLIFGIIGGSVITLLRCTFQRKYVMDRAAQEISKDCLMDEYLKRIKTFGIKDQANESKLNQEEHLKLFEPKIVITPGISWICLVCSLLSAIFSTASSIITEGKYDTVTARGEATLNSFQLSQMKILFTSSRSFFLQWGISVGVGLICGLIAGVIISLTMYSSFSKAGRYWRNSRMQPEGTYIPDDKLEGDYFDKLYFPE